MSNAAKWIVGILVVVLVVVGIVSATDGENIQTNDSEVQPVEVGAVVPLTGPAGDLGETARNGLELADSMRDEVDVQVQDSQSSPQDGVSAFRNLMATNGLDAAVSYMSSVGNAIAPIAEEDELPVINVASAPNLTSADREYSYRWYITSENQMNQLVSYLESEELASERIAFLYINDDYGNGSQELFVNSIENTTENSNVMTESYDPEQIDFRSLVTKVKGFDPSVVAVVGYSDNLGVLLEEIRQQNIQARFVGDDAVSYPQVLENAAEAAEGFVFPGLPQVSTSSDFYQQYTQQYSQDPSDFSTFSYGIVNIIADCAQSVDVKTCLESESFSTPYGSVQFDDMKNGEVPLVLKRIEDGEVVELNASTPAN